MFLVSKWSKQTSSEAHKTEITTVSTCIKSGTPDICMWINDSLKIVMHHLVEQSFVFVTSN